MRERADGRRVFIVDGRGPDASEGSDTISFEDTIRYKHFYRWLREIDESSVLVLDEPLRTTTRSSLHYNCIRHYAAQAGTTVVFAYLPMIESAEDFMILFDFATRSRWRRSTLAEAPLDEVDLVVHERSLELRARMVPIDAKLEAKLAKKKREIIDGIGQADPHTIPRRLYLETGRARLAGVRPGELLVGRNNRLRVPNLETFRGADARPRTVFELCHEHLVFADWLARTRQDVVEVVVADARVDRWYFDRFTTWSQGLRDAYAALRR